MHGKTCMKPEDTVFGAIMRLQVKQQYFMHTCAMGYFHTTQKQQYWGAETLPEEL